MLKSISAIALGSALLLAPTLAPADQSTEPPSPYTVQTPGNGPTVHRHHWRNDARFDNGMIEQRSAAEEPMFGVPILGGAGYRDSGYHNYGVWTGPPNSPYATMFPPAAAPAQ